MVGRWFFLLVGIVLLQDTLSFSPIPDLEDEWATYTETLRDPAYRLPTTTVPVRYEVTLTPYFDVAATEERQFTFDGVVRIWIEATQQNVNEIVLHCNNITIGTVNVFTSSVDAPSVDILVAEDQRVCEAPYSFLRLRTSQPLQLGQEYVVYINFIGNLQTNMRGFYRSFYYDSTGRRWMGTTQFQPGHARQAFPCYDEPGFKSYFDITIIRPDDFSPTISNMPIRETTILTETDQVAETFYTTPYTSTYLLAFIVSHYQKIARGTNAERPFDIYARDDAVGTGDWALEIGEDLMVAMERLTNISYYEMQTNLDMKQAAIPDFSAGAMENWGLLTYREALILYDEQNSNHFYRQRVANIVAHEIAHMWFGNLVTCAWWDNLWLNEGFARFYQYYLTGSVREELGYSTRFIVEQLQVAMFSDSVDSAHPLTDPSVNDPNSVSGHFSTITYAKGACILRMTQHLLGEETYNNGLRIYLSERKFNVAEPQHLFSALDRAAAADNALAAYRGITIDEYFRTWSEKGGYPVVNVAVAHLTGIMYVTQERWERNTGKSENPGLWHIPITWTRGNDPNFNDLKPSQIITDVVTVINRGSTGLEWVIFNKQESGFYRVNYDDTTWVLITRALRNSTQRNVIHEYNRAQIVNDLFSFARAGIKGYERAYNILSFLQFEDEYAPWLAAIDGFAFVRRRLAHDADNLQKLCELISLWSTAAVNRLGYNEIPNESYMDGLFRMYLMQFLCNIGHTGCVNAARQKFANWKNGGILPPNERPWVYCSGLRTGDAEDFNYFWQRYQNESLANEQVVMLQNAGCTSDTPSLERFLDAIVANTDDVRSQDYSTAYSNAVAGNEENTIKVFNWLTNHFEAANNAFGSLLTPLNNIAGRLLYEEDFDVFTRWLEQNQAFMGDTIYDAITSTVQASRANLEWSDLRIPEFAQYFETGYVEEIIEEIIDPTVPPTTDSTIDEATTEAPTTEDDGEPDSANIAVLSVVTLTVTLMINLVM
ncbi:membrane alanyl aminopeptidase-like [Plodia interpunctella]|uniref:membrane alanyl aminopeptidase-like n=1 Tax=Plodia interpunctella TaxID=58824 RepID=UPI0023680672|nr:membrane alanyl aminopeptidase-like [Plodia interpunctella]